MLLADKKKQKKKRKKPTQLVSFDEDTDGSIYSSSPASSITSPTMPSGVYDFSAGSLSSSNAARLKKNLVKQKSEDTASVSKEKMKHVKRLSEGVITPLKKTEDGLVVDKYESSPDAGVNEDVVQTEAGNFHAAISVNVDNSFGAIGDSATAPRSFKGGDISVVSLKTTISPSAVVATGVDDVLVTQIKTHNGSDMTSRQSTMLPVSATLQQPDLGNVIPSTGIIAKTLSVDSNCDLESISATSVENDALIRNGSTSRLNDSSPTNTVPNDNKRTAKIDTKVEFALPRDDGDILNLDNLSNVESIEPSELIAKRPSELWKKDIDSASSCGDKTSLKSVKSTSSIDTANSYR